MASNVDLLEDLIHEKLQGYRRATPVASSYTYQPVSVANRPLGRPSDDEAEAFLEGYRRELVTVDDQGECLFPNVRFSPRWPLAFFFKSDPHRRIYFWWGLLSQIMMYVELNVRYGWQPRQLGIDIHDDVFDGGVFPTNSPSVFVAAEEKPSPTKLDQLLREMRSCVESGCVSQDPRHSKIDGHKKYKGLVDLKPPFFWAVAPGVRQAFGIEYPDGVPVLHRVDDIPKAGGR